jgi:hypothetical protein
MDWVKEANERAIPLWPGCAALLLTPLGNVRVRALCREFDLDAGAHVGPWRLGHGPVEREPFSVLGTSHPPERLCLDLSDPDTCAGFDRRLALAWGAPEAAVDDGTLFWLDYGEEPVDGEWLWQLQAGGEYRKRVPGGVAEGPKWFGEALRLPTRDPILARALAWPRS